MKIIIVGCGKIGSTLAEQLSYEQHDLVVIDTNPKKIQQLSESIDVMGIAGNGSSVNVLSEAGIEDAHILIAVTGSDELNLLCCVIAKKVSKCHTIARVRNPIYNKERNFIRKSLGISMIINPEYSAAMEISRLLRFPSAIKLDTFAKGRVELVEFPLQQESSITGISLAEFYKKYKIKVLICAVQRGTQVYIPDGEFVLQPGDRLHIAASHREMEIFFKKIGNRKNKIKKVLICGGGRVGFYLAKQLTKLGMQVKIIEKDLAKSEGLCEALPEATIIHGDGSDNELLIEEGIGDADAFIALTGMDEENIIMALFAKQQGVPKIVAKVNEDSRAEMVAGFGINSIVSTKSATADAILSYVRARQNSIRSANIEAMYHLVDDRVEALEFIIKKQTSYVGVPLKSLETKKDVLIACIVRNRKIIIPGGEDCLQIGDSVIVITLKCKVQDFHDILV